MAPSNKAAKGIEGKTLHTASKLRGGTLKMADLRASKETLKGLAILLVPAGMLIIDEALQAAGALYHALSLRILIWSSGGLQPRSR